MRAMERYEMVQSTKENIDREFELLTDMYESEIDRLEKEVDYLKDEIDKLKEVK